MLNSVGSFLLFRKGQNRNKLTSNSKIINVFLNLLKSNFLRTIIFLKKEEKL